MEDKKLDKFMEQLKEIERLEENVRLFLDLPKDSKLNLLKSLSKSNEALTGKFLNMVYSHEEDKEILKEIKKILHILKTKGITVDEPPIKGTSVLKTKLDAKEKRAISFITNFDSHNEMVVLIGIELKKRTFLLINNDIEFPLGLKEQSLIPCSKDEFQNIISSIRSEKADKLTIVEAPVVFSQRLIKEASNLSKKFVEEVKSLSDMLRDNTAELLKDFDIMSLDIPDNVFPLKIEEIIEHPFFELFRFRWDGLERNKKTYKDIKNPSIILPQYMIEERVDAFIDSLLRMDSINKLIPFLKTIFEVYAYLFHANGAFEHYKGTIECLKRDEALNSAIKFLIKRELEHEEDENYSGIYTGDENLILNPFDE